MTRALKPLFRPEVLRDHLRVFTPETDLRAARERLSRLADTLSRPDARRLTEENLKPALFSDVFCDTLGYRMPTQAPGVFTCVPEFAVPGSGGFADAVLGRAPSAADPRAVFAAVEVKGPRDPLDIPHAGRRLSAVEQAFDYAINLGCDWIVVTSIAETRLYYKGADRFTCERYDLARIASSDEHLRRFLYVLGAPRMVPPVGQPHLHSLLAQSRTVGENITRQFYGEYSRLRVEAFTALERANPAVAGDQLLAATQKLLDRILFCAFAEDRGLLPTNTIRAAFDHADPYHPRAKWETFLGLFSAINGGNATLNIPRYNGGLFAPDPLLDNLVVPDSVCAIFRRLADYDFGSLDPLDAPPGADPAASDGVVDVEILGHIFERSITDLERMRIELDTSAPPDTSKAKGRRKKEGAFYTPKFITRYIVEHALGPVLRERFEALRLRHHADASGTARRALENPATFDLPALNAPQRDALIAFHLAWRDEIAKVRILDPACGSGAFLIEAFDQLLAAYQASNDQLEQLRGYAELLDLNREILQLNLYGVDLNDEAVEICRLSLWIKTAEPGKVLTALDHTIRAGNSIIADPAVHPRAFNWQAAFPEVFADGGFDVVVGNPPYIRQEWISPFKPYLEANYKAYSGTADFYLYFIEKGLDLLKPGGRLGFITSGTFVRGNFAAPFRQWLPTVARFESLVNFGENQPFEDAEMVYPTISVFEKRTAPATFPTLFIHEKIPTSLDEAIIEEGITCDESLFDESEWKFQPREVTHLFHKVMNEGVPLSVAVKKRMYRGVLTGLNEAFLIDTPTRDRLIATDPKSAEILKPMLKGEDLRPWYQDWEGRYIIFSRRGIDIDAYPAVHDYLAQYREQLEPRPTDWKGKNDEWPGRKPGIYKWFELQDSIEYHAEFSQPKLLWPDIQKIPRFSWDEDGFLVNDKGYILVPQSRAVQALLTSRVIWFALSQLCLPLRLRGGLWQYQSKSQFVERLPVPGVTDVDAIALERLALSATATARERQGLHGAVRQRIATDLGQPGASLNNALTQWWRLDFPTFRAELKKALKADIPVRERDDWQTTLAQWRTQHETLTAQLVAIEEEINDRTNHLFHLTPTEIKTLHEFQQRTKTFYPLGEV
ncbi:hypothetical protein CVU37_02530 [candidate division BRC1 bacterium HGW-BRC1-1]|nr:MAG: hypothetical protein CVU37_02530 [candidate division BRC1 bacterium HGW-BRC1-1]